MALFFDGAWYDQRLSERGLSRAVLAAVAGIASSPRDGLEDVEIMTGVERALALGAKSGRRSAVGTEVPHVH